MATSTKRVSDWMKDVVPFGDWDPEEHGIPADLECLQVGVDASVISSERREKAYEQIIKTLSDYAHFIFNVYIPDGEGTEALIVLPAHGCASEIVRVVSKADVYGRFMVAKWAEDAEFRDRYTVRYTRKFRPEDHDLLATRSKKRLLPHRKRPLTARAPEDKKNPYTMRFTVGGSENRLKRRSPPVIHDSPKTKRFRF